MRNNQSQNIKHASAEDRLFCVENIGCMEKMIAAQNIDCPIVDIIRGSTDAVELQWNINYGEHGQDYLRLHSKAVIENRFRP